MAGTQQPGAQQANVDPRMIEQTRKHINRLREEVARLSEMDIAPAEYFGEFLMRVLQALAAPAGAIWVRTPHGNLQLQAQVQLQKVGLDQNDAAKEAHGELLRQAVQQPRPVVLQPNQSSGNATGQGAAPGNPTEYLLLLAPIMMGNQVGGLVEVWQDPGRHPSAVQGFLQFIVHMCELASRYMRNRLLGEMMGQQELWTKMELFARQIHESLNPVEVAYRVANEGRRLIDCDRVSVGVRYGKKVIVEAVSGADIVEKRSNLVQRMRTLFDRVLTWGEKLIYTGTKDDALPADVLEALDAYLEESASKLLCILPLQDEREVGEEGENKNQPKKKPRSVVMMECFEPAAAPEQLIARLEVLGRHSSSALYNAVEHRRIPFRFVWMPVARLQEGLGGKARAIAYSIAAGLLILAAVLYFVPYPLKMDASGALVPEERRWVYCPSPGGKILRFNVDAGNDVAENQNLVLLYNHDVEDKLERLQKEIKAADRQIEHYQALLANAHTPGERANINSNIIKLKMERESRVTIRDAMSSAVNIVGDKSGQFWLRSPMFPYDGSSRDPSARWTILNWDYKEKLTDAEVKPSDPILRLGYKDGPWEVVLKIPQKHIGQVLKAFDQQEHDKRSRLNTLLGKSLDAGWLKKFDLVEGMDPARLAALLVKSGAVEAGFGADNLSRLNQEEVAALVDKVPLESLLRESRLKSLQHRLADARVLDRAVQEGWIPEAERDELLREPELDVDLLVKSAPTQTFVGKLARSRLSGAAEENRTDQNEAEPVVIARVRIAGEDIPADEQIPRNYLVTDTQVNAKVRCGNHRMGYSLFYGVWEFFYEKVVFFF